MVKLHTREATPRDVAPIANNLRHADLIELTAVGGLGLDVREIIEDSFQMSSCCWVLTADFVPVVMWGVAPIGAGRIGAPWLLASKQMDKLSPRQVLKYTRRYVPLMRKGYELLANYVHCENEVSIRWLKRSGFAVAKSPTPWGPYAMPFCLFTQRGEFYNV